MIQRLEPEGLARQRTCKCGNIAARLHSHVRRQPRTWAHHTTGSDDDWSTFQPSVARQFMGRKVRPSTHASTVPQLDEVIIWAMQEREHSYLAMRLQADGCVDWGMRCAHP